jgi:hypothetical protein
MGFPVINENHSFLDGFFPSLVLYCQDYWMAITLVRTINRKYSFLFSRIRCAFFAQNKIMLMNKYANTFQFKKEKKILHQYLIWKKSLCQREFNCLTNNSFSVFSASATEHWPIMIKINNHV